jgi:nitroreductase
METSEAIQKWRSIRRYKSDPVPEAALRAVLEAGRRAPSWSNVQPWHFLVIEDAGMKAKLAKLARGQKFLTQAPVVIAVCGDLSAWDKPKIRAVLIEMMQAGVLPITEEIVDKVMLNDQILAIADKGPAMILARTFEQLGIAYGFMGIEAVNQGLGMCIVGAFGNEATAAQKELYEEIKSDLSIPDRMYLLALLPLGVPDEAPKARPRKEFNAVVSRGRIGQTL